MVNPLKSMIKKIVFASYKLGNHLGFHLLPIHYYTPVVSLVELEKTQAIWAKKSRLPDVLMNTNEQAGQLETVCKPFEKEYEGNHAFKEAVSNHFGPGYGYIEAQALHGVIRHYKPKQMIEVGSGVSTYCALKAFEKNQKETGDDFSITCIEPYPSQALKDLNKIQLRPEKVQAVPFSVFEALEAGDLLFIDSAHTLIPGGDVSYIILEILPRLKPGVIVHIHDIYFPYDYQPNLLKTYFHWMETSLLRAFLTHNNQVQILFCLSLLHHEQPEQLKTVFPEYDPELLINGLHDESYGPFEYSKKHLPASIYLQIK